MGLPYSEQRGPEPQDFFLAGWGYVSMEFCFSLHRGFIRHRPLQTLVDAFWLGKRLSAISPETDPYFFLSYIVES